MYRCQKKALSEHALKMVDKKDRMRRNNIRLVGFPEGVEGETHRGVLGGLAH